MGFMDTMLKFVKKFKDGRHNSHCCNDLHAADTRYHYSCRKLFMNPKNVRAAQNPREETPNEDATVASLVKMIKLAKDRIWTSIELHSLYLDKGGKDLNCCRLLNKVTEHMGNEVVVLSSPGVASIIMLIEKASQMFFKFERVDEEGDDINLRLIPEKTYSKVKILS